ncbi:MBL fold metallo-hydrolase [Nosocomiicoccus massiliensis]|uniref:MBL fold metallo-hydrolase n=1 Tax=Nosocomiicoccus massiliensis TaxID=1232430 RepID=UPI0003FDA50B|nr:MBL fold metallo-hydrolase [Nosocomiicoccus massiliensis]
MEIITLPLGALYTNCYIVYNDKKDCLIFDPAANSDEIIRTVEESDLTVKGILLTHSHYDHIGALEEVSKHFNLPVYMNEEEAEWLVDPTKNGSIRFIEEITADVERIYIGEGELSIGEFDLKILHTPGHSPGSLSYIFEDDMFIISGDVLFNKGVGRTDLYGGNTEAVMHSIKEKLFNLNLEFDVYPGHGMPTTLLEEKYENPNIIW